MNNYLLKYGKIYFQKILKKKINEALTNETEKEKDAPRKVVILD